MQFDLKSTGPSMKDQFHILLNSLYAQPPLQEFVSKRQRRAWYRNVSVEFPTLGRNEAVFDLDLGPTGFHFPMRWERLLKEYLPLNWGAIDLSRKTRLIPIRTLVYHMKDRGFHPKGHQNGACLNTCYFWGDVKEKTLRFHFQSRASYILPVGPMDVNLMYRMAESIMSQTKFQKFSIRWSVEQVTTSIWPSLPYLLKYPELRETDTWIAKQWKWADVRRHDADVLESPYQLFRRYGQKKFHTDWPEFIPAPIPYQALPQYKSTEEVDPLDHLEEVAVTWEPTEMEADDDNWLYTTVTERGSHTEAFQSHNA